MVDFYYVTGENTTIQNLKCSCAPDHPYGKLIIGSSGSGRKRIT